MKNLKIYFLVLVLIFSLAYLPSCKKSGSDTPDPTANFSANFAFAAQVIFVVGVPVSVQYVWNITINEIVGVGATINSVLYEYIDTNLNVQGYTISPSSFFGTTYIGPNQSITSMTIDQLIGLLVLGQATSLRATINFTDTYGHNVTKIFTYNITWF